MGDNFPGPSGGLESSPLKGELPSLGKALETSGESRRLREYIAERLVQSGWRDELKSYAVEFIKTKGAEN